MKEWLVKKHTIPRWVVLSIMILSVASFVVTQAKAHELHWQKSWAEHELAEITCNRGEVIRLCSINQLMPPPIATITTFVEMQIGLLFTLGIVIGTGWIIVRG